MLGNLADFDPDAGLVAPDRMEPIDRWVLYRFDRLAEQARKDYDAFEFHRIYQAVHNFCVVDLSNFYLDVLKDRLYVERAGSATRRAAQSAMFLMLDGITRLLAPILAFTSDEIWRSMPHRAGENAEHVLYNDMPEPTGVKAAAADVEKWDRIQMLREDVKKALEIARKEKTIGASLDAKVELHCTGGLYDFVKSVEPELPAALIVSQVAVAKDQKGAYAGERLPGLSVTVSRAEGVKCARCWTYSATVGSDPDHPDVCARCAGVLKQE